MKLILTLALSTPFMAADVHAAPSPRPGTAQAVQCLLGQELSGCVEKFQGGRAETAALRYILANRSRDFETGPVVSITYWGRDKRSRERSGEAGDVFDVKFTHAEYTFYISRVENGKIRSWAYSTTPPSDPHGLRISPV
jgi:hypothetical protein